MEKVYQYLKDAKTFFLATTDGDQPHVRPFGAVSSFDGKLCVQTNGCRTENCDLRHERWYMDPYCLPGR